MKLYNYSSGWDSEKKVVKGKITVVVSSIEESSEDQPSDTAADVETGEIPVQVRYCTARYTCAGEKEYLRQPDVLKE